MSNIGSFAMPIVICIIILFGFARRVPLFDTFLEGAKEGMRSTAAITPSLVGLITAVSMLKASGALDILTSAITPIMNSIGFPPDVIPLAILRPISGSGSIAMLNSIFDSCGVDSFAGRIASIMMGSTETTFYTMAVYLGSVGIKNMRHTLSAALIADAVGIIMAVTTVRLMFNG